MQDHSSADFSEQTQKPDLVIPRTSLYLLMETAKWGKFLSIAGFVGVGLILILAFGFGFIFDRMDPEVAQNVPFLTNGLLPGIYILMALLYFFPCLYLFKFSQKIKSAVLSRDQTQLVEALTHQKSLYKFIGIFTLIVLCFYAVIFLFLVVGALFPYNQKKSDPIGSLF